MMRLARRYGPFYKLSLVGRDVHVASSRELVHELCDEQRFDKKLHTPLMQRAGLRRRRAVHGRQTREPIWGMAHRILMPAFGPVALRSMFDGMVDVAEQLLLKWERLGPRSPDRRLRQHDPADPRHDRPVRVQLPLQQLLLRPRRTRSSTRWSGRWSSPASAGAAPPAAQPADAAQPAAVRRGQAVDVRGRGRADRRAAPPPAAATESTTPRHDAERRDPVTGERLPDENIRYQLVTFLIAGHETTSGLLIVRAVRAAAEPRGAPAGPGAGRPGAREPRRRRFEDLARLRYLDQILKEVLRLWPTAPAFAVYPRRTRRWAGGTRCRAGRR